MNQGRSIRRTKETITDRAVVEAKCKPVAPGTVVLSFKLSIGKVGITDVPMFTNEAIAALPILNTRQLIPEYLFWALKSVELADSSDRAAMGATLNKAKLLGISIPLPSLAEQRRIADILDKADSLRAKRRHAARRLKGIEQSLFLEAFGDPLTPDAKTVAFKSIARRITYGFTSPMKHLDAGIPIITAKNVKDGAIDFSIAHFADETEFQALTRKSKPVRGDILITKDGTIGRCAVVETESLFCINQSVALVQPEHDRVMPEYVVAYLATDRVQRVLNGMGKGNALAHLQITELAELPMPLPPRDAQQLFVQRVRAARSVMQNYAGCSNDLDALFASLQHRAFRGEL